MARVNVTDDGRQEQFPHPLTPRPFKINYNRVPMPDPGIGYYPLSTLALKPLSPIGPATAAMRKYPDIPQPPLYASQAAILFPISGAGQIAGTVWSQGLFDPNAPGSGFTAVNARDVPPYQRRGGRGA